MKQLAIASALSLVLVSSASAQVAAPPTSPPPRAAQMTPAEQITRLNAIAKECFSQREAYSNQVLQRAGDAAADHEDLEGKLNTAIAHQQALQKLVDELKAKYEPEKKPDETQPAK